MKIKQYEDYTDEEICRLMELGIVVLPNRKEGPLTTPNHMTIKIYDNIIILNVKLSTWSGGAMKIFSTREQVNRFVDDLTQARDLTFTE